MYPIDDSSLSIGIPEPIALFSTTFRVSCIPLYVHAYYQDIIIDYICHVISHADPIALVPRVGNMLGGTAVRVTGPCLDETDVIICTFDVIEVAGVYMDEMSLLCVSPILSKVGEVNLELKVINAVNSKRLTYTSSFYSGKVCGSYG